jgi:hypothetical protein
LPVKISRAVLLGVLACGPNAARAETVVLTAARLVDGRGGSPLVPAMVRVEVGRIAEVGGRVASAAI